MQRQQDKRQAQINGWACRFSVATFSHHRFSYRSLSSITISRVFQAFDITANNISGYYEATTLEVTSRYYFEKLKGLVTGTKTKVLETTTFLTSTNYYDDHYRVIQTLRDIYSTNASDNEIASILYDFSGKVVKTQTKQVFLGNTNTVIEKSSYDHAGRLIQVKHQVNSGTEVALASMQYDEIGQLKQKSLNGEVGSGIQNLNYSYNIHGWLEKINIPDVTPSASSTQKLNLGLYYNNVPSGLSANQQFNGNISGLVWNTPEQINALSPADKQGYGFTYDGLNRMRTSNYGEGATFASNINANNENVDYDKNGNITFLTRYRKGTGLIDNLSYTYKNGNASNMLDKVDDTVAGDYGFSEYVKQSNEYAYDSNGNLIKDDSKGYNSILYNYLNLPKRVGTTGQYISYVYDAAGTKLAKINTGGAYTYYAGSFVYSGSSLNYIIHREGMYLPGGNYQYYLKDHLGNTRLVVNTSGTGGEIVQQTDYYPFGMDIKSYNSGIENKYRYNGKEFQDDLINGKRLEWYDFGARMYDPIIGRWNAMDPLAEKYFRASPYCYVLNNPIKFSDIDGRDVVLLIAPAGAGGYGHMGAIIQDGNGNWHYMTVGNADRTAGTSQLVTSGAQGGMVLKDLGTKDKNEAIKLAKKDTQNEPYTDQIEFSSSTEMDAEIFSEAQELKDKINSGDEKYNALTNNCADAVETVVEGGTGVDLKSGSYPSPNKKAENIKKNQKETQKKIDTKVKQAEEKEKDEIRKSNDKTSKNQY